MVKGKELTHRALVGLYQRTLDDNIREKQHRVYDSFFKQKSQMKKISLPLSMTNDYMQTIGK